MSFLVVFNGLGFCVCARVLFLVSCDIRTDEVNTVKGPSSDRERAHFHYDLLLESAGDAPPPRLSGKAVGQ